MPWQNIKEIHPKDKQVVLVSLEGVYRVMCYHNRQYSFEEITTKKIFLVTDAVQPVYWTEIQPPENC